MANNIFKTNKQKAILGTILAAGLLASLWVATSVTNVTAADRRASPPNPYEAVKTMETKSPKAEIVLDKLSNAIPSVALKKIQERSEAANTEDLSSVTKPVKETPVTVGLYYDNTTSIDTVAVTVDNSGSRPIFVFGLVLGGYIHGEVDSAIQTIYRPIISDPYNVVTPTRTNPIVVPPGQTLTAFIKDDLDVDGYAAKACYTNEPLSPDLWKVSPKEASEEEGAPHIPTYCTVIPVTWLQ